MASLTCVSLFLAISVWFQGSLCVTVKILEPRTNGSVDAAVIITPGARIAGEAYQPLG